MRKRVTKVSCITGDLKVWRTLATDKISLDLMS